MIYYFRRSFILFLIPFSHRHYLIHIFLFIYSSVLSTFLSLFLFFFLSFPFIPTFHLSFLFLRFSDNLLIFSFYLPSFFSYLVFIAAYFLIIFIFLLFFLHSFFIFNHYLNLSYHPRLNLTPNVFFSVSKSLCRVFLSFYQSIFLSIRQSLSLPTLSLFPSLPVSLSSHRPTAGGIRGTVDRQTDRQPSGPTVGSRRL